MSTLAPWLERQLYAFATKQRRKKADRPKTHAEQEQDLKSLAIIAREIDPAASEATFWSWIDQITSLPDVDADLVGEEAEKAWEATKSAEVFVPLTVVPTRQQRKYTLNTTLNKTLDKTQQPDNIPVVPEVVVASVKTQRTHAALLNLAREHGLPYSAISVTTRNLARALREVNGDRGYVDPLGQPDQSTAAKHLAQAIEDGVVVQLVPGRPHDADTGMGGICGIYGVRGSFQTAEQVLERGRATFVYRQRMKLKGAPVTKPADEPVFVSDLPPATSCSARPTISTPSPAAEVQTDQVDILDFLAEVDRILVAEVPPYELSAVRQYWTNDRLRDFLQQDPKTAVWRFRGELQQQAEPLLSPF